MDERRERARLSEARVRQLRSPEGLAELEAELKAVNESLWNIEERIRALAAQRSSATSTIEAELQLVNSQFLPIMRQ